MKKIVRILLICVGGSLGGYISSILIDATLEYSTGESIPAIRIAAEKYLADSYNSIFLGFLIAFGIALGYELTRAKESRFSRYIKISILGAIGSSLGFYKVDILGGFFLGFFASLGFAIADDLMVMIKKERQLIHSDLCYPIYALFGAFGGMIGFSQIYMWLGVVIGGVIIGGISFILGVILNHPLGIYAEDRREKVIGGKFF